MDFGLNDEQKRISEAIGKLCTRFGDDYWLERDREGGFPADFHQAFAKDGWLGIAMPEEFGGAGLGISEAAVMMQAIAQSGASSVKDLGAVMKLVMPKVKGAADGKLVNQIVREMMEREPK